MSVVKAPEPIELLKQLSARFDVEDVGQRVQGGKRLDYIGIDKTITRFNEVLGVDWSFTVIDTSLVVLEGGQYLATVSGQIDALGKHAGGVGADVAKDPDKAIKTALAECLKKASHSFGVALYLWNEEERNTVEKVRVAIASGDELTPVKTKVLQKAVAAGVPANAKAIAAHFGVSEDDLKDIEKLKAILNG